MDFYDLSDITYSCLALELAITARAGHFTDAVIGAAVV